MATLDYVEIPPTATRLRSNVHTADLRLAVKITTPLPRPSAGPSSTPSTPTLPLFSPTKSGGGGFNLPQMLLGTTLQLPAGAPTAPRAHKGAPRLLSTKDPLSIPITTMNFRRFVSRVGPVFWLQDRVEEIVMWRRGWKYTAVWMALYTFLCQFPRLLLLLPLVVIIGAMLATHPSFSRSLTKSDDPRVASVPPPPPAQSSEGSVDWLANVQAIQNLMGAFSDGYDIVYTAVPHVNHSTPYTPVILSFSLAAFAASTPLIYFLPVRLTCLILGLTPFFFTHPTTQHDLVPLAIQLFQPRLKVLRARLMRLFDNDRLEDRHLRAELREVELWENERWAGASAGAGDDGAQADAGWSKTHLRPVERKPWTRGRDGWSGVTEDGTGEVSSNLTFSLSPGWLFVETEDWRPDLEGRWLAPVGADDNGWVYTNDMWMNPHAAPAEEWKTAGMTRRRRWTRRIYYDSALVV